MYLNTEQAYMHTWWMRGVSEGYAALGPGSVAGARAGL